LREPLGNVVKQIIPPPKDAVVRRSTKKKPISVYLQQRNQAAAFIQEQDNKAWKMKEGYHQQSLSVMAMFRYKNTFSAQIKTIKQK